MRRFTILLSLCLVFVSASTRATVINVRPAAGVTAGELSGLQSFLNTHDGGIDVLTDQNGAAIWAADSGPSTFAIKLELSGYAGSNKLGLYNYGTPGTKYELFQGPDTVGYFSVATLNAGGIPGKLVIDRFDDAAHPIGSFTYIGVNAGGFGFYLDFPDLGGTTFYSEDDLNEAHFAHNLVYAGTGANAGRWWLAFEDLDRIAGSDEDFTDMVVLAQSISPVAVPEPGSLALFGFGLAGGAAVLRHRTARRRDQQLGRSAQADSRSGRR
jgi:hypothetical protein